MQFLEGAGFRALLPWSGVTIFAHLILLGPKLSGVSSWWGFFLRSLRYVSQPITKAGLQVTLGMDDGKKMDADMVFPGDLRRGHGETEERIPFFLVHSIESLEGRPVNRRNKVEQARKAPEDYPSIGVELARKVHLTNSIVGIQIAIFWDMGSCKIPADVQAEHLAGNIRKAIQPLGGMTEIFAYADCGRYPLRLRKDFFRTGIKIIDVPNKKKVASKAMLLELLMFVMDHRPPCHILVISGDLNYYAYPLRMLTEKGYVVIVALNPTVEVTSSLSNACQFFWDWPNLAPRVWTLALWPVGI